MSIHAFVGFIFALSLLFGGCSNQSVILGNFTSMLVAIGLLYGTLNLHREH